MPADRTAPHAPEPGFGLYVHWPFCLAKCPYCDFNSHVSHQPVDYESFERALTSELRQFAVRTPGRRLASVFFGGGTPSLMPPRTVGRILEEAAVAWEIADDIEVTLEANPTSVEAGNFAGYRSAGVDRVSVGIQALDDVDLKALGRQHSVQEALTAFRLAARVFPRTSFDLIYARPRQTVAAWRTELTRALGEQDGHMSLYQLTIEPGTAYAALHAKGRLAVPDEDRSAALFEATQELTAAAGLNSYEVSNHARKGHESRHNLIYWRYGEYAGIGPGAHSRLTNAAGGRIAVSTIRDPKAWLAQVQTLDHGIDAEVPVTSHEAAREKILMGLRLDAGLDLTGLSDYIDQEALDQLIEDGLLVRAGKNSIATTSSGRMVLNAVIQSLAA